MISYPHVPCVAVLDSLHHLPELPPGQSLGHPTVAGNVLCNMVGKIKY